LAELLTKQESATIVGRSIGEVLEITRPILGGWSLPAMLKLTDQSFFFEPTLKNGTMRTNSDVKFKGCLVKLPSGNLMLVLSPDAKNVAELTRMGLTMSDLPLHSFQRDAVFLGEHISSEVCSANFSIAVLECIKHVCSPVDGKPFKLWEMFSWSCRKFDSYVLLVW
jgi:hypothetical protein